jgi:uncharacterized membrane protein YfcA
MMLTIAVLLLRAIRATGQGHDTACDAGEQREMTDTASGETHRFCAHRLGRQPVVSSGGAFLEGLISAGTGEVTVPRLIMRSGYPIPIAVATSLVLVVIADFTARITHFTQFAVGQGLDEVPWNVIVWGAPGMAAGAYVGARLQGRFSDVATKRFFSGLFALIGVVFLVFTVFRGTA